MYIYFYFLLQTFKLLKLDKVVLTNCELPDGLGSTWISLNKS